MIKNIRIQKLIEISKKNRYDQARMAVECGVSVATWNRWVKPNGGFTKSQNTIKQIDKFIAKNK